MPIDDENDRGWFDLFGLTGSWLTLIDLERLPCLNLSQYMSMFVLQIGLIKCDKQVDNAVV